MCALIGDGPPGPLIRRTKIMYTDAAGCIDKQ